MNISSSSSRLVSLFASAFLSGCYTMTQGYEQARLFAKRVPLEDVLKGESENAERLEKLRLVPRVLDFAERELALTPGSSYRHYISLDRAALSFVVQASEKRKLKMKTWWFPIVGAQPYLGFFDKSKAIEFQMKLVAEGLDTSMGGVQAFSLLGYFPDPIYSSMVDGNNAFEFVELLFHETLHRTIYVPNAYTFNENLADFVARHATVLFLRAESKGEDEVKKFLDREEKIQAARQEFREFLKIARNDLEAFYSQSVLESLSDAEFIERRKVKFAELHEKFQKKSGEKVAGTHYASFFHPDRFNNATLLGASVYESRQEPFERLLVKVGHDLAKFISVVRKCVVGAERSESEIWNSLALCER